MPALFIGTATRRVGWIKVFVTFFPQHSETFRRFQYADRGALYLAVLFLRWLVLHGAGLAPSRSSILVLPPASLNSPLCRCHASAKPLALASDEFSGRSFHCIGYKPCHTACNDEPLIDCAAFLEKYALGFSLLHILDI